MRYVMSLVVTLTLTSGFALAEDKVGDRECRKLDWSDAIRADLNGDRKDDYVRSAGSRVCAKVWPEDTAHEISVFRGSVRQVKVGKFFKDSLGQDVLAFYAGSPPDASGRGGIAAGNWSLWV